MKDGMEAQVELYKILLADRWDQYTEETRRSMVRRMVLARYGAFTDEQFITVTQVAKKTDIYKSLDYELLP